MQQQNQSPLAILRILLVRHGLSEDNLNSIWAGHKDSPLSPTGVLQAKALGAALANQHFSAIYSSDLKRASRTAEEILQANRSLPPPPLVQTQSLREQNFGQAEGKSWNDAEVVITNQGDDERTFKFPEGESLEDVNNRMGISLRRYVLPRLEALRRGQEKDEPQIVIVAHGIAIAEVSAIEEDRYVDRALIAMLFPAAPSCSHEAAQYFRLIAVGRSERDVHTSQDGEYWLDICRIGSPSRVRR